MADGPKEPAKIVPPMEPALSAALQARGSALSDGKAQAFLAFAEGLFSRLHDDLPKGLTPQALATIALGAFRLLDGWREEAPVVRIERLTPDASRPGTRAYTVVHVLNVDKPFLVSSVVGELQARGLRTHALLHPVLWTARSAAGDIVSVHPHGSKRPADQESDVSVRRESIIVAIVEELDAERERSLKEALEGVLGDVEAAVADWLPMRARLAAEMETLEARAAATPDELLSETIAFCRWLLEGQFVFLGMREYRLDGDPETGRLTVIPGSGLGILANPDIHVLRRGRELVALTDEVRRFYLKPSPIIITKSNVTSRIHRRVHMDYIGLKTYGADGRLQGELRMVGLLTAGAYNDPPAAIPFLRLKVDQVFETAGIARDSHEGRMLQNILDTFPRDELIQIGVTQLSSWVPGLLQLEFDPRVRVFARRDRFDRFVSVMVFVPRDRFSTSVRERVGGLLADMYAGRMVAFQPYFTAGPLVRVSYIIGRYEGATPIVEEARIEAAIEGIVETWQDRLDKRLAGIPGGTEAYARAFSASYSDTFPPERALEDIERIGHLRGGEGIAIDFYQPEGTATSEARVALYRESRPIPLSERVPLLERLGFAVIDERTFRLTPTWDGVSRPVCMHDMTLRSIDGQAIDLKRSDVRLEQAFLAAFEGRAASDLFNRLVMAAGLDWREAAMLRAYAAYMRQIGLPFEQRYVAETLARHAARASDLVRLFKARFNPAIDAQEEDRARVETELAASFEAHLEQVPSLDEDRILRTLLGLVRATKRTNFFQMTPEGAPPPALAFKIASAEVKDAPEPRPFREIWVTSGEVDGVHLRFAPIARGGLRWSDRAQDFRTEVLGLAKAQQVKNTVIVPQGAKGGFFPKLLPEGGTRDDIMKAGISAYRRFVSTLLDVTDNLVDGAIVPPRDVVRRDGDDPYLVVAADKGTATFSDFANELSQSHGFWLGDAFASGGSAGYDHKKMGITARGAWECVKRHFREMDHDIQTKAFRVVGVGDMSGDVFGNGMLLSPEIRLVAAFDHRDIFIDPSPDAQRSFAERQRMFALPRSSWQDYDWSAISEGGGIFSRSAKSIELTPQMRAVLVTTAERLAPTELINAILKAPFDLMWFGGIGTYVRGDQESNADVGDRANDALRIPASQLRAKVVGEGANLGMTQRARIDFAANGGRLNTDFIDNSAGVNSSDQEVNIKIALAPVVASGRLDTKARNELLTTMTEDVAQACLDNNYWQSLAISLAERRGAGGMVDAAGLMRSLEQRGLLNRALEVLPDPVALERRRAAGRGLTRPELAVLLSYAKLALSYDLAASSIIDEPSLADALVDYFPPALRSAYARDIAVHPLRREIVTTTVTNRIVNIGGPDLPQRLSGEFGLAIDGVARAALAGLDVVDARRLFSEVSGLDNRVSGDTQLALYAEVQRLVRERAEWFAAEVQGPATFSELAARHRAGFNALAERLADVLPNERLRALDEQISAWSALGVPTDTARHIAAAAALSGSGDITLVAEAMPSSADIVGVGRVHMDVGQRLRLPDFERQAREIAVNDRYDRMAVDSALSSLSRSHRAMTAQALSKPSDSGDASAWWAEHADLAQARERLGAIIGNGALSVARLTVGAAQLREVAERTRA